MATKLKKIQSQLNDNFRNLLDAEFEKKFGIKLYTYWNFGNMTLVSSRVDGEKLTSEQEQFTQGYSEGYLAAMNQVIE